MLTPLSNGRRKLAVSNQELSLRFGLISVFDTKLQVHDMIIDNLFLSRNLLPILVIVGWTPPEWQIIRTPGVCMAPCLDLRQEVSVSRLWGVRRKHLLIHVRHIFALVSGFFSRQGWLHVKEFWRIVEAGHELLEVDLVQLLFR